MEAKLSLAWMARACAVATAASIGLGNDVAAQTTRATLIVGATVLPRCEERGASTGTTLAKRCAPLTAQLRTTTTEQQPTIVVAQGTPVDVRTNTKTRQVNVLF
jgi:hypothetical protein